MPEIPESQTMAIANQPEIVARTENPLQDAVQAKPQEKGQKASRDKTIKKTQNTKATEKAKPEEKK